MDKDTASLIVKGGNFKFSVDDEMNATLSGGGHTVGFKLDNLDAESYSFLREIKSLSLRVKVGQSGLEFSGTVKLPGFLRMFQADVKVSTSFQPITQVKEHGIGQWISGDARREQIDCQISGAEKC